jgi:hypothetical protein
MKDNEANDPPRYSPKTMRVSKDDYFSLRIPSGRVALQLTRWLLTKFYRSGRKYSTEELAICYLLDAYWNSYRNKAFFLKNETQFLKLRLLMRYSCIPRELEKHEKVQEKLVLSQTVLYSPRAFLSLPEEFAVRFLSRTNLKHRSPHPELRRIGVGYRDKGTASVPSYDGSPRWKEVAVSKENRREKLVPISWWEVQRFLIS